MHHGPPATLVVAVLAGATVVSLWESLMLREFNLCLTFFATASQQPADRISTGKVGSTIAELLQKNPELLQKLAQAGFFKSRSDSGEFVGIYDAMRIQLFSLIPCYSRPIRGATVVSLWDSLMLRDTTLTVTVLSETQGSGFERTGSPTSAMIGQSE